MLNKECSPVLELLVINNLKGYLINHHMWFIRSDKHAKKKVIYIRAPTMNSSRVVDSDA